MKHLLCLILLLGGICSHAQQPTDLTVREVYDFGIGDVYQYRWTTYNYQGFNGVTVNAYTTYTLIARNTQTNQLVYTWHRLEESKYTTGMSGGTNYKNDTVVTSYTKLDSSVLLTSLQAHDTLVLPPCNYCHVDSIYTSAAHNGRTIVHHYQGDAMASGYTTWGQGLGLVIGHLMSEDGGMEQGADELVYYRKANGETWGDLYVINYVGISDNKLDNKPIIYSNSGMVMASLPSAPLASTSFTIYNLMGQIVSTHLLETKLTNIDLGMLPKGLYLWRIEEAGKTLGTGKLITQ